MPVRPSMTIYRDASQKMQQSHRMLREFQGYALASLIVIGVGRALAPRTIVVQPVI